MCDIQYEEFDNKESIFHELENMFTEEQNEKVIHDEKIKKLNEDSINIENENLMTQEIPKPIRMSDLYSNFSCSWKSKLKSREPLIDSSTISTDNDFKQCDNEDVDTSDIDKDTSFGDNAENSIIQNDEVVNQFEPEIKSLTEKNVGTIVDCCSFQDEKDIISEGNGLSSKMITSTSIDCDFEDVNDVKVEEDQSELEAKIIVNPNPKKKIMVESSCDSFSDTVVPYRRSINRNSASRNVALSSFGCNFDATDQHPPAKKQEMITTSTETDDCEKPLSHASVNNQADETYNSLEQKILPFIKHPNTVELKLKGRLSVFQTACVKQIASQHKLMMKSFGKGQDSFILLRKKIELLNSQKEFLEMKKAKQQKEKQQMEIIKAKQQRLLNPPKTVSSGCQVDLLTEEKEAISKTAARKNRKKQWQLKQKEKMKKNSSCQTIEKGFYVCPYCEDDIPESLQFTHYPHCLEKYRSRCQSLMKSGKLPNSVNSHQPRSHSRKNRSKSREKVNHSKIEYLKKELEKVHDNDINAIMNIITELDKKCSVTGCNNKKNKTCSDCSEEYCYDHFAPDGLPNDKHFNCPVILEMIEVERQKKLGNNNPLLKTIEQLTAPKFSDGVMIKRQMRVKMVPKPVCEDPDTTINQTSSIPNNSPPDINQTRTRNGPMFSYERNNLRKDLREKISSLVGKRSK